MHFGLQFLSFVVLVLFSVTSFSYNVNGEKILVLEFLSSKSHKNVYDPLIYELAHRGHSLTVISPYQSPRPHKNIRDILGMGVEEFHNDFNLLEMREKNEIPNPFSSTTISFHEKICKSYYDLPEVKEVQKQKFDLVIASSFINECTFGMIYKANTTFMFITTFAPLPWTAAITGTPSPPSFVPLALFASSDRMSFFERLTNFIVHIGFKLYVDNAYVPHMEKVYRDCLGSDDIPSAREIEKNVSLILANSHFSLNYPRPFLPDILEVGGMHCRVAEPLPKDLNDFVNAAGKDGFIYFSMGSIIKAKDMPEKYRKALVGAFSKLKQRVLWKWEDETMDDLPKNVNLRRWYNQQDILGHPNIKLFITHGGLLSIEESVYHGVPIIGIPVFGDQSWNIKQAETNGFALSLEFSELTEEKILTAINKIISDTKYSKRVKELSTVFKDRPQKPLDTAIFWTEYIMRHKGAVHLRSPSRDLSFYEYHSLDVISLIFAVVFMVFMFVWLLLRKICSFCRPSATTVSKKKKKN